MTGVRALEASALLAIVEQAGLAVVTLVEGLECGELLRSRLTRAEVLRQLKTLADSMAQAEPAIGRGMPELDWSGWNALRPCLSGPAGEALDEALWFACESLVPATLLWLRVYRQSQPRLFQMQL
ncbi:hypothetical protein PY257_02570 [Ramlibacter sp. H39-3-26]|uniref:hypothetical protein n=1 Tax=Curvibacter soli TaxID=3031331 RepID=UPI0023DA1272|nr:hypothetical protein [Ramlibacter sp. H39-3-26]MDF1484075.1 hypothetical protein [Ramlibacter sp. H39-3-26]